MLFIPPAKYLCADGGKDEALSLKSQANQKAALAQIASGMLNLCQCSDSTQARLKWQLVPQRLN